jgi:DNA-binding transcriptional regulator YiaG
MANKALSHDSIADELMTNASRTRAKTRANAILKPMTLDELRRDRKMTQDEDGPKRSVPPRKALQI